MDYKITDIAERIRGMRDILDISVSEMAVLLELSESEYISYERGERDFSFTFLFKVAKKFNIDMTDLLTGRSPNLLDYTIVRRGEGLPIERRKGFSYESLASQFKGRTSEPYLVVAKHDSKAEAVTIPLNSHDGQEFDFIISGSLRFSIDGHETILYEGDSVYYNSKLKHGMVAVNGDCKFMAVIMSDRGN